MREGDAGVGREEEGQGGGWKEGVETEVEEGGRERGCAVVQPRVFWCILQHRRIVCGRMVGW